MRIAAELIATGRASHAWLGAQVNSDIATRGARIIDVVKQRPPQPETVTALLPRLHVENASAMRPVDALRARLATTSRVRRYQSACAGYGSSSTSSTDDHQGEAARLSRVCRGLGLTVDAPRLRQAARWNTPR